jgi:hypothetical protein
MKQLLFATLLAFAFASHAQQRNTCLLFENAYTESAQGFPSLRMNVADTSKEYKISIDTLALYGLVSGYIYRYPNLLSTKDKKHTFTNWVLQLNGPKQFVSDSPWEQQKEVVTASFQKLCEAFGEQCFSGLNKSELILAKDADDSKLLSYYFYPKEISIPASSSAEAIEEILSEVPHIVFVLTKPWAGKGYYMNYIVSGVKYE